MNFMKFMKCDMNFMKFTKKTYAVHKIPKKTQNPGNVKFREDGLINRLSTYLNVKFREIHVVEVEVVFNTA